MNEDKASTDRQKLHVRCQGEDSTSHVEGRSLTLPLLLPTKLLRPRYWISWLTGEAHRLQSWSCLCDGLISRVRQWISATPILSLNNILVISHWHSISKIDEPTHSIEGGGIVMINGFDESIGWEWLEKKLQWGTYAECKWRWDCGRHKSILKTDT